jgi:predicted CoA-binding protein
MHCDNLLLAQRDIVGFKIRHQQHKHRAIARLIGAFSKKRKDRGYVLMAERSGFRILFIRPTKTADSINGWGMLPRVQ